jgi:hypothetical protein
MDKAYRSILESTVDSAVVEAAEVEEAEVAEVSRSHLALISLYTAPTALL